MHIHKVVSLIILMLLVAGVAWYVVVRMPQSAPWEESGTLVIITRTIPEPAQDTATVLGLGLKNLRLLEEEGSVRLALTTQRILLDVQDTHPYELLRTEVGTGAYRGIAFSLKSPEFRNDWQGDTPPEHLALVSEEVSLDMPFTIEAGKTTVVLLGFETLRAVRNRNDALLYLPVIHTEVRTGATIEPGGASSVVIRDGIIVHNMIFGMDWDGVVRKNFRAGLEPVSQTLENTEESPTPIPEESVPSAELQPHEETATTSLTVEESLEE